MDNTASLHGGPAHGQKVALPLGSDHFHVLDSTKNLSELIASDDPPTTIPFRKGTYSRVRDTQDFEWDGWRAHD